VAEGASVTGRLTTYSWIAIVNSDDDVKRFLTVWARLFEPLPLKPSW
jgi:hypothetical protein